MIWFWFPLHEHWPVYLSGLSPQVWSLVSCFCMNSCFSSFCSIFLQEKVEAQTGCQLVRLHRSMVESCQAILASEYQQW